MSNTEQAPERRDPDVVISEALEAVNLGLDKAETARTRLNNVLADLDASLAALRDGQEVLKTQVESASDDPTI